MAVGAMEALARGTIPVTALQDALGLEALTLAGTRRRPV